MGILFGIILYPSISETKRKRYIIWGCRVVAAILIVLAFELTIRNFCTSSLPRMTQLTIPQIPTIQ